MGAKRIALSNGRKLVSDVIEIANKMPLAAFARQLDLAELNRVRLRTRPRIAWDVVMMRAYGIICRRRPELRQMLVKYPWRHLYQAEEIVCSLTMAREHQGEERLFFARFVNPDQHSLAQLQERYEYLRRAPVEEIQQFRHQIRFARLPTLVRKACLKLCFDVFPKRRAKNLGTFGMSISSYKEAIGASPHLGPMTTTLGVDPRPRNGRSRVLLTFDHNILDGKPVVDILQELDVTLNDVVKNELEEMSVMHCLGEPTRSRRGANCSRSAA